MIRFKTPVIDNKAVTSSEVVPVRNPYSGDTVEEVRFATEEILEHAIRSSERAFHTARKMKPWQRAELLFEISQRIRRDAENLARIIMLESGKPIRDARVEVHRAAVTFHLAAGEAERLYGEIMPLDIHPTAGNRIAWIQRFPVGVVAGITPFNFPLNLVAHKVAPAIAAGCSILLKPSSSTPLTALRLAEILMEAGAPEGLVNTVPCKSNIARKLAEDSRIKHLTFTGSAEVGWRLKQSAGKKHVALELGGNAAVIVTPDWNLEHAVRRCVTGGYAYSGQICISLQRIYVQEAIFDSFLSEFKKGVGALIIGDPASEDTRVGPMITEKAAATAEKRVMDAINGGGTLLTGGKLHGAILEPTIIVEPPANASVNKDELFAPVTVVYPYHHLDDAINAVNDSAFGLQAGIFSDNWHEIWQVFNEVDVGGVIAGDVPTIRVDNYPYGGIKDSGQGREGVRFACEEMTEYKTLVLPAP